MICLLISLAACPVSALPLTRIVELCSQADSIDVIERGLLPDGWKPITPAEYDTFAGMMADNYLRIVQPELPQGLESPIGRNWPDMVEKTLQNMDWYLDAQNNLAILTRTDEGSAFAFLEDDPINCIIILPDTMYEKPEVERFLAGSSKWLTPVGYKQTKFVRDLSGNGKHYRISASWATSEDLRKAGSTLAGANLIFAVGQFEKN